MYTRKLDLYSKLKKNSIHKKIMESAQKCRDEGNMRKVEAIRAALSKRTFLSKVVLAM